MGRAVVFNMRMLESMTDTQKDIMDRMEMLPDECAAAVKENGTATEISLGKFKVKTQSIAVANSIGAGLVRAIMLVVALYGFGVLTGKVPMPKHVVDHLSKATAAEVAATNPSP